MFSKTQEEYLLRRLNKNEVVLFLGAGFSVEAQNKIGENFPIGKELSKKIWQFMYPKDPLVVSSVPFFRPVKNLKKILSRYA